MAKNIHDDVGWLRRSNGCLARLARQMAWIFGWLVSLLPTQRAHAEDHVDTRYEYYGEEGGRVKVRTYSLLFEQQIIEAITARGELIYDGISGATPNGSPPLLSPPGHGPPFTNTVPVVKTTDIRRAGNLTLDWKWGVNTLSPQVSYSKESDYRSLGVALSYAIDFNQKNTTLRLGGGHNFDKVEPKYFSAPKSKDTTDAAIGISQLLTPYTVLAADFGWGEDVGYLTDPYKGIRFDGWLPNSFIDFEKRPGHRMRETGMLTLTQFIKPVNASAELSYRIYHDSYEILSHTTALTWRQKIGRFLVLEPTFRYYYQSAANFYHVSVHGLAASIPDPARPEFYSADYRLSRMETFTYGAEATVRLLHWMSIDIGYQRYEMFGLDNKTSPTAYPKANIVNAEVRLWF